MSKFAEKVVDELNYAREQHGKITGAHDAYGRILEEVDEFWEEVKKRKLYRNPKEMLNELVQIGAMAQRAAEDLDLI
jgi:NTP pyrophosphatase (non-canonical NTP hydrolase)